jgi:hypothetical protein
MAETKTSTDLTPELVAKAAEFLSGPNGADFSKLEAFFHAKGFNTDDQLWAGLCYELKAVESPGNMAMYSLFIGFMAFSQRARKATKAIDEARMWLGIDESVELAYSLEKIIGRLNKLEGKGDDAEYDQ